MIRVTDRTEAVYQLVRRFETATLPRRSWDHLAHLEVALWYLLQHGLPNGFRRMREGLRRYNRRTGATDVERGAYHETVTLYEMWMLESWRRRNAVTGDNAHVLFGRLRADTTFTDPGRIFRHYSIEHLFRAAARYQFVAPDKVPLPRAVRLMLRGLSAWARRPRARRAG